MSVTKSVRKIKIKKAQEILWNMLCEANQSRFKCFTLKEYNEFCDLGYLFCDFTQQSEFISFLTIEEKFLFISFLIEAFPDLVDAQGNVILST